MITLNQLKQVAKDLHAAASLQGLSLSYCQVLDIVSKSIGYESTRDAVAKLDSPTSKHTPVDQPPTTGEKSLKVEYTKFKLRRNGDAPIVFNGVIIGEAVFDDRNKSYHYIRHTIYRTSGGGYVAQYIHDISGHPDTTRMAEKAATAEELVEWLRSENGAFQATAQLALERAAHVDDAIEAAYCSYVE